MRWMHRNRTLVAVITMVATLLAHVAPVASWYDPKTGRFLQRDPNGTALLVSEGLSYSARNPTVHIWLTPQLQYGDGMNFYQYVMSNPVNYTDPSGLFTLSESLIHAGFRAFMMGLGGGAMGAGGNAVGALIKGDDVFRSAKSGFAGGFAGGLAFASGAGVFAIGAIEGAFQAGTEASLRKADWQQVATESLGGAILGGLSAKLLGRVAQWWRGKATVGTTGQLTPDGIRYGPHVQGPIDDQRILSAFRGGVYTEKVTTEPMFLYRVFGEGGRPMGNWWSRSKPTGPLQARMDLALPPSNSAQNLTQIQVPVGTTIYEGAVEQSFGQLGGGQQVYLEFVDPSWAR